MTRLRGVYWRRCAALAAVWGLFCQLALAAVALPLTALPVDPVAKAAGYTTVIICTGTEMRRITLDPQGNPVDEGESEGPAERCVLCHITGKSVLPAAPDVPVLAPHYVPISVTPAADQICCDAYHRLCPDSRAPPLEL